MALSDEIATCQNQESLVRLYQRFIDEYDGIAAVAYSFRFEVGLERYPWTPLFSTFPEAIENYYRDNACLAQDPLVRAALSATTPVRFLDIVDDLNLCPVIEGLYSLMAKHGIRDGLSMQIVNRQGQVNYASIAFGRPIDDFSEFDRRRIHACTTMFLHHSESLCPPTTRSNLSRKEQQVVDWIAKGASHKDIARRLSLSPNTVRTHIERSYEKLGAHSRTEAALSAIKLGHASLL